MRTMIIAIATMILFSAPLIAQEAVDGVLDKWRNAMSNVRAFEANCERINRDAVFKTEEKYSGKVRFLRTEASILASSELKKVDDPDVFEKFILGDRFFHEFRPTSKEIRVHDLKKLKNFKKGEFFPSPGEISDGVASIGGLLMGEMKMDEAKKRFTFVLENTDDHYYYLKIGLREDRPRSFWFGSFDARLALIRTTFMPVRMISFRDSSSYVHWDFTEVNPRAEHLRPADFQEPALSTNEWKFVR